MLLCVSINGNQENQLLTVKTCTKEIFGTARACLNRELLREIQE